MKLLANSTHSTHKVFLYGALTLVLAGCSPSPEAFVAVHQVASDPLVFALGGPFYLTKERNGDFLLVKLDANNEVAEIKKLF